MFQPLSAARKAQINRDFIDGDNPTFIIGIPICDSDKTNFASFVFSSILVSRYYGSMSYIRLVPNRNPRSY